MADSSGCLRSSGKTDNRLLFPFDGAPTIGPFDEKADALSAAATLGVAIVDADIANSETRFRGLQF